MTNLGPNSHFEGEFCVSGDLFRSINKNEFARLTLFRAGERGRKAPPSGFSVFSQKIFWLYLDHWILAKYKKMKH